MERLSKRPGFRPRVYICSPYAGDDCPMNVKNAQRYCRHAVETGSTPFAAHLLYPQFMRDGDPTERQLGLSMGLDWLAMCAEVWVFGEYISPGMELEIHRAEQTHVPVRYFTADCQEVSK